SGPMQLRFCEELSLGVRAAPWCRVSIRAEDGAARGRWNRLLGHRRFEWRHAGRSNRGPTGPKPRERRRRNETERWYTLRPDAISKLRSWTVPSTGLRRKPIACRF